MLTLPPNGPKNGLKWPEIGPKELKSFGNLFYNCLDICVVDYDLRLTVIDDIGSQRST